MKLFVCNFSGYHANDIGLCKRCVGGHGLKCLDSTVRCMGRLDCPRCDNEMNDLIRISNREKRTRVPYCPHHPNKKPAWIETDGGRLVVDY